MKRFIIYFLLGAFSLASFPSDLQAGNAIDRDKDKDKSKSSAMAMKPKKLSKHTAKMRKTRDKDRKKQMLDIKKSNKRTKK